MSRGGSPAGSGRYGSEARTQAWVSSPLRLIGKVTASAMLVPADLTNVGHWLLLNIHHDTNSFRYVIFIH